MYIVVLVMGVGLMRKEVVLSHCNHQITTS